MSVEFSHAHLAHDWPWSRRGSAWLPLTHAGSAQHWPLPRRAGTTTLTSWAPA